MAGIKEKTGIYERTEKHKKAIKKGMEKFIGKHQSQETEFKKGHIGYWKGKKLLKEHKQEISKKLKGKYIGNLNHLWKGGRRLNGGYIYIYSPNHPYKNSGNCVAEERLIMEKYLHRYLKPEERVHHINGIKNDNRIENLKLFSNKATHAKYHWKLWKRNYKKCPTCNGLGMVVK